MDETEHESPDRPDITRLLPRYRLRRQLSSTFMSEVFLAEDTWYKRDVALKVIKPELMRQPRFASRFRRETRIAAALHHPHIVPVYEVGTAGEGDDAFGYLVMRYVEGVNLGRLLGDRGRLALPETVTVAREIAAALDAAHKEGIVHRDVKPANILVDAGNHRHYLCDFGIAKHATELTVTSTGAAMGSAFYWSPEQQTDSKAVDLRSDVYSLGCVLYDCLAGLAPTALRTRRNRRLPAHGRAVDAVLHKAMSVVPDDRQSSCGELAGDLATAAARTVRRRWAYRAGGVAGVALALAAVLALVLLVVVPDNRPAAKDLARVPAALRGDCRTADPSTGASAALSCRDASGRTVAVSLFPDATAADRAYRRAVGVADVGTSQGDCLHGSRGEQRYPTSGPAQGRVVCYGHTSMVWVDDGARTVSRVTASDAGALRTAWAGWTDADPSFPTAAERSLVDVAAGTRCTRVAPGELDTYRATAGVTCTPRGSGARSVSYYAFASRAALEESLTSRVKVAKAVTGAGCAHHSAKFLGTGRHDWLGVDLGQVLCRSSSDGTLRIDWSMEPLLVAGTVTGADRPALTSWWAQWHLAPLSRIVKALNAHASPPFPTDAEQALLRHIPRVSRLNCIRPSPGQVWHDVGAADVTGVACGPTSGAGMVVYYRFHDAAAMRAAYNDTGGGGSPCTQASGGFSGSGTYAHGRRSGRLRCGTVEDTHERYLEWTDDRLAIAAYASEGRDPVAMLDWWTHDAGPE